MRRLNAEAVEAAQQEAQLLAEEDAAVAEASGIQDAINKVEEEKSGLAAALDDVMHGAYYERRIARAKAEAAKREVRRWSSVGVLLLVCSAARVQLGFPLWWRRMCHALAIMTPTTSWHCRCSPPYWARCCSPGLKLSGTVAQPRLRGFHNSSHAITKLTLHVEEHSCHLHRRCADRVAPQGDRGRQERAVGRRGHGCGPPHRGRRSAQLRCSFRARQRRGEHRAVRFQCLQPATQLPQASYLCVILSTGAPMLLHFARGSCSVCCAAWRPRKPT